MGGTPPVVLRRAEEEEICYGVEGVVEARGLVGIHGQGCPHSGNLSQGSCTLSGCMRGTWTHQESRPGNSVQYTENSANTRTKNTVCTRCEVPKSE